MTTGGGGRSSRWVARSRRTRRRARALRRKAGGLSLIILLAAYVPYAGVGSILVARRPRNVIGWVLLGMGWTFAVSFLPIDATAHELQTMTASPLEEAIAWLTEVTVSLTFALFATLAFMYPTGRLARGVGGGSPCSCWR